MIGSLLKLYAASMAGQVHSPVPHLFGPPGSGKSTMVQEVGRRLGVRVHIVNVSRLSPLELEGVQMPEEGKLHLLLASMWNRLQPGDIVLWDEFLACSFPEVFNGLLDIITSREVGGHKLPPVFMIAASNTTSTYASALEDRLLHLPVPDLRQRGQGWGELLDRMTKEMNLLPDHEGVRVELASCVSAVSLPAYDVLDQLEGKGALVGKTTTKVLSPRKLVGMAQLRLIDCPKLANVLEVNNYACSGDWENRWKHYTVYELTPAAAKGYQQYTINHDKYLKYATHGLPQLSKAEQAHHLLNMQMIKIRDMTLKEES